MFQNHNFETIKTTLNQVSPQLTDALLKESATPELQELSAGELFIGFHGGRQYENNQVKMAQALLIDVVLGGEVSPESSLNILFSLKNQTSDLSKQDEERILINFAISQGANPSLFSPFEHTDDIFSGDLMWEVVRNMLPSEPDRAYHLLETLFYNDADPSSEDQEDLTLAPINLFSALCAAPEIDDILIARLMDKDGVDIDAHISLAENQNNHLNTPLGWAIQDESENGPKKIDLLLTNGANRATLVHNIDNERRWENYAYWGNQENVANIQTLPIDDYVQQLEDSPRKTALLEILNRHPLPNP